MKLPREAFWRAVLKVGLDLDATRRALALLGAPDDLGGCGLVVLRAHELMKSHVALAEPFGLPADFSEFALAIGRVVEKQGELTALLGPNWIALESVGRAGTIHPHFRKSLTKNPLAAALVIAPSEARNEFEFLVGNFTFATLSMTGRGFEEQWLSAWYRASCSIRRAAKGRNSYFLSSLVGAFSLEDLRDAAERWLFDHDGNEEEIIFKTIFEPLVSFCDLVTGRRVLARRRGGHGNGGGGFHEYIDGEFFFAVETDDQGRGRLVARGIDSDESRRWQGLIHPSEAAEGDELVFESEEQKSLRARYAGAQAQNVHISRAAQESPWAANGIPPGVVRTIASRLEGRGRWFSREESQRRLFCKLLFDLGRPKNHVANARFVDGSEPQKYPVEILLGMDCLRVLVPTTPFKVPLSADARKVSHDGGESLMLPMSVEGRALIQATYPHQRVGTPLFEVDFGLRADHVVRHVIGDLEQVETISAARLMRCSRQSIIRLTSDRTLVTMLTGQDCGPGVGLYYNNLDSSTLRSSYKAAMDDMGVELWPIDIAQEARIGCEGVPRFSYTQELVADLLQRIQGARLAQMPLIERHHSFMAYAWVVFAIGLALRGVIDPLPDVPGSTLVWREKGRTNRVAALTTTLSMIYTELKRHRQLLANHLGIPEAAGRLPLLSVLDRGIPRSFRPRDIEILIPGFALPTNCFRKLTRSELSAAGVPGQLIDVILGHGGPGHELWSKHSAFDVPTLAAAAEKYIEPLLKRLGVVMTRSPLDVA